MAKLFSSKGSLLSLNPFLDINGILLVGGRLRNSHIDYTSKHTIILPSKHHFTKNLMKYEHLKNLHAGPRLILSTIRQNFWIIKGRPTVRNVLNNCLTCFKVFPSRHVQKMADLTVSRVTPGPVFLTCGLDYAGPYQIKEQKFRNEKFINAYLCIFVFFSTKAVYIELVSDLSTEGFLNALKRCISRRRLCAHSDNASNFVCDNRTLQTIANCANNPNLKDFSLVNKISWHFSPPRSPHFGGLWEAAARLTKYHLNITFILRTFTQFVFK